MSAPLPLYPERPQTRGDCEGGPRPCPWAGCRYHLVFDQGSGQVGRGRNGGQLSALAHASPEEAAEMVEEMAERLAGMRHTCALDIADAGGSHGEPPDPTPDEDERATRLRGPLPQRGESTLVAMAAALGMTRERTRQIEEAAMRKFRRNAGLLGLAHLADGLGRAEGWMA